MVMRTAPGTTVPVEIYRAKKAMTLNVKVDELNLAQEQETVATGAGRSDRPRNPRNEPKDTAFGMQSRHHAGHRARSRAAGQSHGRGPVSAQSTRRAARFAPGCRRAT